MNPVVWERDELMRARTPNKSPPFTQPSGWDPLDRWPNPAPESKDLVNPGGGGAPGDGLRASRTGLG